MNQLVYLEVAELLPGPLGEGARVRRHCDRALALLLLLNKERERRLLLNRAGLSGDWLNL
jgi:hypothetical protein